MQLYHCKFECRSNRNERLSLPWVGFRDVTPEKFLQLMGISASFWAISWPNWLVKLDAVVDMCLGKIVSVGLIHVWCMSLYGVVLTNQNIA